MTVADFRKNIEEIEARLTQRLDTKLSQYDADLLQQ